MTGDATTRTSQSAIPLDGLLVVDKPAGWTSHDVVAKARRITGVRRVGHAGTLDPAATGVLPLGIGQGTRVLEYLSGADKAYRATVRLGLTTDTDDAEGAPLESGDWHAVTEEQVRAALAQFVGEIEQVPPAYSAIKQAGVPLHRLARAGRAVRPPPRRVTIERITLLELALPDVSIEVECSKGPYIRSLARDLGVLLGCGAHLTALRRLRTGPFTLDGALSLDDIAAAAASGGLPALIVPPDVALLSAPVLVVGHADELRLLTGRSITRGAPSYSTDTRARAYAADGTFLAIVRAAAPDEWAPDKVFAEVRSTNDERQATGR